MVHYDLKSSCKILTNSINFENVWKLYLTTVKQFLQFLHLYPFFFFWQPMVNYHQSTVGDVENNNRVLIYTILIINNILYRYLQENKIMKYLFKNTITVLHNKNIYN